MGRWWLSRRPLRRFGLLGRGHLTVAARSLIAVITALAGQVKAPPAQVGRTSAGARALRSTRPSPARPRHRRPPARRARRRPAPPHRRQGPQGPRRHQPHHPRARQQDGRHRPARPQRPARRRAEHPRLVRAERPRFVRAERIRGRPRLLRRPARPAGPSATTPSGGWRTRSPASRADASNPRSLPPGGRLVPPGKPPQPCVAA